VTHPQNNDERRTCIHTDLGRAPGENTIYIFPGAMYAAVQTATEIVLMSGLLQHAWARLLCFRGSDEMHNSPPRLVPMLKSELRSPS